MAIDSQEALFSDFEARQHEPSSELLARARQYRTIEEATENDPLVTACTLSWWRDMAEYEATDSNMQRFRISARHIGTEAVLFARAAPSLVNQAWHANRFRWQLHREFPDLSSEETIPIWPIFPPSLKNSPKSYAEELLQKK